VCILLGIGHGGCKRSSAEVAENAANNTAIVWQGAYPAAILQTGRHPLWFQLTEKGPVHIGSIEDAVYSAALIPWPLALHISFVMEADNEIVMAVNRDGFLKLAPYSVEMEGIALYRFSGGEFWRHYTIGGLVHYNEKPAAVLYLDDRFLDSSLPPPNPRTWTFSMESNALFGLDIPALEIFPAEEGWGIDTLRRSSDGFWYYRVSKKSGAQPELRIMRTINLAEPGRTASLEDFYNSAPRETEITHPSLPALPKGFIYTGIGRMADSLFASWEEQEDFSIGAAGFVILKIY